LKIINFFSDKEIDSTAKSNSVKSESTIDKDFYTIIADEIDDDVISKAIRSEFGFIIHLKPYLFDLLKRNLKFTNIKNMIYDYVRNNETTGNEILKSINERSLLSGLIESVSTNNQARLGYYISKSDYPIPILYELFNSVNKSIEYKVNFNLLSEVLSHTRKCLAIISGTTKTVYKGKSSLIPLLFPGLNNESISKLEEPSASSYVDVLCNDENNEDWIIADFHGRVETNECNNLLKSFSSFANIHVLNVTIDDFNKNYEPSEEIQNILSWYRYNNNSALLVILIRDMDIEVLKKNFIIKDEKRKNEVIKDTINSIL
jgi:hypothetical protein